MEEDFDLYGPQPDRQQEPAPQTMEPVPFTQADNLRLQRIHAAMSDVQDKVAEGDLHPEEGDILGQQLLAQQKPLLQRQQAAKQLAVRQQAEDAMQFTAISKSIEMANTEHSMRALPSLIQSVTEPLTGKTKYFMPPGYTPVEFQDQTQQENKSGTDSTNPTDSGGISYMPIGAGLAMGANPQPQGNDLPPAEPKLPPERPTPEGGTHTMEIWNGGRKSVGTYVNGKLVSVEGDQTAAPDGWNKQGQQGQQQEGVNEIEAAEFDRRARNLVQEPRWSPNPHERLAQVRAYEQKVAAMTNNLVHIYMQEKRQKSVIAENQRKEGVRAQEAEQKKQQGASEEKRIKDRSGLIRHYEGEVRRDMKELVDSQDADGNTVKVPKFPYGPEYVPNEVMKRVIRHEKMLGLNSDPESSSPGQPGGPSDAQPQAQSQPGGQPQTQQQAPAQAVLKQQTNRFDALAGAFSGKSVDGGIRIKPNITPAERAQASGAIASLRTLIEQNGGDVSKASKEVQDRAKEYGEIIRRFLAPKDDRNVTLETAAAAGSM